MIKTFLKHRQGLGVENESWMQSYKKDKNMEYAQISVIFCLEL